MKQYIIIPLFYFLSLIFLLFSLKMGIIVPFVETESNLVLTNRLSALIITLSALQVNPHQ